MTRFSTLSVRILDLPAGRSAVPQGQGDSILVRSPSPWVLGEGVLAPSSPDLNPMDYSIWSILEVNACVTSHAKVEALKASLKTAWVALSQNVVRAAVEGSERRLEAVARAKRGHIAWYVVRCERRDGMCLCMSPQPNTLTDDLNTSVLLCCRTYGGPCRRSALTSISDVKGKRDLWKYSRKMA